MQKNTTILAKIIIMNIIETYRKKKSIKKVAFLYGLDHNAVSAMIPYHVKQEVREDRITDSKNFIPLKEHQLYCIAEMYERGSVLKEMARIFQVPEYHLIDSLKNFQAGTRMPKPPNFMHEPELVGYDIPNFKSLPPTTDDKAINYMMSKF